MIIPPAIGVAKAEVSLFSIFLFYILTPEKDQVNTIFAYF